MTLKKTDPNLVTLVDDLKRSSRENGADIWRDIALRLEKPRRNWAEVNLSKLERFTSDGDIIVVAGKVLGAGAISKKITVAAYDFSESARKSIAEAGGSNLTLMELVKQNPNGSGVKIMR
jgi:large subunit ribosomal protein L18e